MKRKFLFLAGVFAVSLLSVAAAPAHSGPAGLGVSLRASLDDDQKIIHLLNRIGYGPKPGDIEAVRKLGIDRFIDRQLHPETIDNSSLEARLTAFPSLALSASEINRRYVTPLDFARQNGLVKTPPPSNAAMPEAPMNPDVPAPQFDPAMRQQVLKMFQDKGLRQPQELLRELQGQKLVRAVYSERQLEEVMVDFWYNHFNVFWGKGADKQLTTPYEMKVIRPHVLGKFKDLVMATAKSPAMLFYLDNFQSSSPTTSNQAQERLAQLSRLPRLTPNQQAQIRQLQQRLQQTPARKPGINENYARELMELHTMGVDGGYTQKDVQEVARAFTGWTIDRPRQDAAFAFRDAMHDRGDKMVLGHRIDAGGIRDGEEVIDILVHQPSTAHFIATKLVRRFVNDDPPKALVDRVAATYMKTDGDIREMLRTILTSDEFNSRDAYRAKTKSPFELVVSSIRALGGDTDGAPRLAQEIGKMGQPLYQYQPPTGFPDRASQWTASGSLVERLNFGLALCTNRIPGTSADLSKFSDGTIDPEAAVTKAVQVLLAGDVSQQTRKILTDQLLASSEPGMTKAFALILGSPEFQKR